MATGSFCDDPITIWLTESGPDLHMKLVQDFRDVDPAGRTRLTKKDMTTDGASIPRALWSSVGSPFTGDYRRAAIVHDTACDDPAVPRKDADRMFYEACLTGGCSLSETKLRYAGVRIGAWAHVRAPVHPTAIAPAGTSLPSGHTPDELELRARYTRIARQLEKTPDRFEAIDVVVSSGPP